MGAAAQFGIFATVLGGADAELLRDNQFSPCRRRRPLHRDYRRRDGPTAIYLSGKLPRNCWGDSGGGVLYMALVPLIQPPAIEAAHHGKSEKSAAFAQPRTVSKRKLVPADPVAPAVALLSAGRRAVAGDWGCSASAT
ncbi:hypothetical protein KCP75_24825 [Salmonella enterica subsp. enterica]|nr:hypothetical protein KCP75_24825 [Salmonella enterica subsp. enterica]